MPARIPAVALVLIAAVAPSADLLAQPLYLGNDLSYANQMEDCGAVFKEAGEPKDVYQIFADHGTNLVRVRLWVDPSWQNDLVQPPGVEDQYSDLKDVRETIERAREAGMLVLLDLHYSDFWADPGRQAIPARWAGTAYDTPALADSVYQYTARVLGGLDADGLMPELVQVGNETNPGMLIHTGMNEDYEPVGVVSWDWGRQSALFNAAIQAIREVGQSASVDPRIVIHFADPEDALWRVQRLIDYGITDFDIIGLSFYYAWHGHTIEEVGGSIRGLRTQYPGYDVAVVETGYPWSMQNYDPLGNIITTPDPAYLPVSPGTQLEYQVDLTREVLGAGAVGVVFWEPAWVSTPCRTPWGQGSSHDHVAFFDPVETDFMANGGGRWTEPGFYADLDAPKTRFKVDMTGQNTSNGVYLGGDVAGHGGPIQMAEEGRNVFSTFFYLPSGSKGKYYFLAGPDETAREVVPGACADAGGTDRAFSIGAEDNTYGFLWGSCEPIGSPTSIEMDTPYGFALHAPLPNPVRSSATITYEIAAPVHVMLVVYDVLGRRVRTLVDQQRPPGTHHLRLDTGAFTAGTYVYRLITPSFEASRLMMVVR